MEESHHFRLACEGDSPDRAIETENLINEEGTFCGGRWGEILYAKTTQNSVKGQRFIFVCDRLKDARSILPLDEFI